LDILTIILKVLLLSVAIFIVAKILPKVTIKSFGAAIAVAVVLSILNFGILWLLGRLPIPINIITFGLFNFVIFAFLLWLIDQLMESIEIKGLETALLAAFLITVFNVVLNWVVF